MRTQGVRRIVLLALLAGAAGGWASARAGERYALLVGVRKYPPNELRPLPYAEADVTGLSEALQAGGYKPGNVVLMTQARGVADDDRYAPRGANIRAELKLLLDGLEEDDSIVVALAGHGVQFRGEPANYFCPSDVHLADKSTLIDLADLYGQLERCKAGLKVLLVDACRNDPQSDNSRARAEVELESVSRPQAQPPPGGIAAFFSCSAGQKAYEHADLKHGVFFHFVIEALQGKATAPGEAEVTMPDVQKYVSRQVRDFVRASYKERQNPELKGTTRDVLPLVTLPGRRPEIAARPGPKPAARPRPDPEMTGAVPPRPATRPEPPDPAALRDGLARLCSLNRDGRDDDKIRLCLVLSESATPRDFAGLTEALGARVRAARVVAVAQSEAGPALQGGSLGAGVEVFNDFRRGLDSREIDAMIYVGFLKDGRNAPQLNVPADDPRALVSRNLIWSFQAGKDAYVSSAAGDTIRWSPKAIGDPSGPDSTPRSAMQKYARVASVGGKDWEDFEGWIKSVKSRETPPNQPSP